jgi:hypothetical protein
MASLPILYYSNKIIILLKSLRLPAHIPNRNITMGLSMNAKSLLMKDLKSISPGAPPTSATKRLVFTEGLRSSVTPEVCCPRKRNKLAKYNHPSSATKYRLPRLTISPGICVSNMLVANGFPSRLGPVSVESLTYFEHYRENHFPKHLSNVVREGDLIQLQAECPTSQLRLHNLIGESVIHLICRWRRVSSAVATVRWLLDEVHLPINVRDRHGRTPLHAACMIDYETTNNAQFGMVRLLLERAPELLLFEDNQGRIPLDLVPFQEHVAWKGFFDRFDLIGATSNIPDLMSARIQSMSRPAEEDCEIKTEDLKAAFNATGTILNKRSFHLISGIEEEK